MLFVVYSILGPAKRMARRNVPDGSQTTEEWLSIFAKCGSALMIRRIGGTNTNQ